MAGELDPVCQALGLAPTAGQTQALLKYLDLLQRWNATYNLTAVRERGDMLVQHLADCLTVVPALSRHRTTGRVLDVGSGAGLPGVVLAILLPTLEVSCVDTVGKKTAFVQQLAGELGLPNLRALHARVESLRMAPFDIITSRAFASLHEFTQLSRHLLAPGGVWLAMKGKTPEAEIDALPAEIRVFHVEPLVVPGLDAERCLVWMHPVNEAEKQQSA